VCLSLSARVHSHNIETITVDFTRTITKEQSDEVVSGVIYYQAPTKIFLKVKNPICQWMSLEGNTMLIYYPDEQRAFRFHSEIPFTLPFFQAFLGMDDNGWGLSKAGFRLSHNQVSGDTLITYWEPPKAAEKTMGNFIIGFEKEKLLFMKIEDAKGHIVAKTSFQNHHQYGSTYLPMKTVSVKHEKDRSYVEKVVYSDPKLNVALPPEVLTFEIPSDTDITEIEW
jgi:outer membrane lipoprotein-sorting protein